MLPFLLGWLLFWQPLPSLLLVDRQLKTPLRAVAAYSYDDFIADRFPIHAADRQALINILEVAAKSLENPAAFRRPDTLLARNSRLLLIPAAVDGRLSVRLITQLTENLLYDFTLIQAENRKRKIQQALLNLRYYLSEQVCFDGHNL